MSLLDSADVTFFLDTLPYPQAICDSQGRVLYANPAAWSFLAEALAIEPETPLLLHLSVRATLSHLSLRRAELDPSSAFLANVQLHHADAPPPAEPLGLLNVTLTPLPNQRLAVRLAPQVAAPARATVDTPERRVLLELDAFISRTPLLGSSIERLTLLVNTLQALYPDLAFIAELGLDPEAPSQRLIFPWPEGRALLHELPHLDTHPDDDLSADQLLLPGARRGLRFLLHRCGFSFGLLQVESRTDEALSASTRAALRLAANLLTQTLAESAELTAPATIDQLQALVCICDPARRLLSANARFREQTLTQHTPPAALAQSDLLELLHPDDREAFRRAAARTMGEHTPQSLPLRLLGAHPEVVWRAHLAFVGGDEHVAGFSLILHAPEATEPASQTPLSSPQSLNLASEPENERFIALGRLAAGIAHEIKNPLTSILSYSDYLLGKYRDRLFESRDSERLERIIQGVERIDRFVRDLLTYARPEDQLKIPVRLNDLLRESAALCEVQLRPVHLDLDLAAPEDLILAVPSQIQQIFINLLCNAAEAIPPRRRGELRLTSHADPGAIVITLQDNGRGIPTQHLEHIFDPFFTRRPDNTGTGLGLSIVRKLAAHHDATIDVQSAVDEGTTFTLRFPIHSRREQP